MNPFYHGDNDQKSFYQELEKLTDRELQEYQCLKLSNIENNTNRIKNNVIFWFYLSIAITLISIAILSTLK